MQPLSAISLHHKRKLIVSFHDLHPGTMECCARFLQRLETVGVPRASLLVVPNWYHQSPIARNPELCDWLQQLDHDISLHGYAHRAGHRPEKPVEWLMANIYTAGEGEFYKLSVPEADMLLFQGLELFRQAGIQANGFIAPAWLMENEHIPIVEKAELSYCVTFKHIYDLKRLETLYAPVLCTTSRTRLRRALTRQVVSGLARKHRNEPILRIAVHPVDFQWPEIEHFIFRLIEQCLADREPTTYQELVSHQLFEGAGKNHSAEKQIKVVGKETP
ncbi:polysaccharide deacetylase family protein [Pontiellaceae bacterium B12219]|nr:polysaccharide deacetylase family protein [Pontiellaceae bacterium B12219]